MREVRPLRSTGITPLPRYYEPVRLPAAAASRLWIPASRCSMTGHPAGSPRTLDDSVSVRPPQPPRTTRRVRLLVASPTMSGFTISGRLAVVSSVTRSNRVRLRWARAFAVTGSQPARSSIRTGEPVRFAQLVARLCRTAATRVNEQSTWPTPFSRLESPGLTWRTRERRTR